MTHPAQLPVIPPVPPTLVTTDEFKLYARIETNAEDTLIGMLLAEAVGLIESFIGKSLTTEEITFTDNAASFRAYESARSLILPYMQIDPASIAITDPNGNVVDATSYTVRLDLRQIVGIQSGGVWGAGYLFGAGPYAIKCIAGYGTLPDYKQRWLPRIRATIMDYTAFLYQQRTPGATSESAAGTRVDYALDAETGLPYRLAIGLRKLRGIIA